MQTIIQRGWNDLAQTMPEEKHSDFHQGVEALSPLHTCTLKSQTV